MCGWGGGLNPDWFCVSQWRTEGGLGGFNPPSEIPKALQNRAKNNPIVKAVKIVEFRTQHPKMFGRKVVKV